MAFWNGAERMRIQATTGNVGIGAPTLPTDVYTATGGGYAVLGMGQSSFLMAYKADDSIELCQNTYVNTSGANNGVTASVPAARLTLVDGQFVFQALQTAANYSQTAQNVLTIANSGSIGIGRNTASYKLSLISDATVTNGVYISAGTGSGNHALYVEDRDGTAEFFAVRGDGEIRLNASNQGHTFAKAGIRFGTNASANNLDDYEEGTWTPVLKDLSNNPATLSTALGTYTKIGRQVIVNYDVRMSSKASMTGNYVLLSLPFNHAASVSGTGTIDKFENMTTAFSSMAWDVTSTVSVAWLVGVEGTSATSSVYVTVAEISDTTKFKGTIIYHT